jgi:IMP dehydrogenase
MAHRVQFVMAKPGLSEHLSFDDVLLTPQYSEVVPADVDVSTSLAGIKLKIPILSAAMDTVTESAMMTAMAAAGGIGVLHKNLSPSQQMLEIEKVKESWGHVPVSDRSTAIAVGVNDWRERLLACRGLVDLVVIDSAHGHSKNVMRAVSDIRAEFKYVKIMAGNVVTPEAVRDLATAGADIIKCGIGPGSICTTRLVSGCGMPQFSAIMSCAEEADKLSVFLVADGGIRCSGDIVKALAAGADAVMIGSMLAGTTESPGEVVDGQWKNYRGMGSVAAMERGSKDRYGQSGVSKDKLVPEGVEAMVPYKGSIEGILHQLVGGLKSGMGYVGAADLSQLRSRAKFVRVTTSGIRENGVHDVKVG